MNERQRERAEALYLEALERPAAERAGWVREACGADAEVLVEVLSLLDAAEDADGYFAALAGAAGAPYTAGGADAGAAGADEDGLDGTTVGPFRLLRELGRGGIGTVFLAERADGQFEQRVAVKLLRRGLDTDDILARFRAERQILASLDHPNIARLLDGGATADGRPYLVMETVEGRPITEHCDERRCTVEERLRLFVQVARAVEHAHRRLVVHRDIKPSNILVSADGAPKLLDFGIAKLLDESADAEWSPHTRTGVRLLTPEYASPEQLRGEPVTTASDAYQLGILLFRLLCGRWPHRLPRRGVEEAGRRIGDQDPEPPSAALLRAPDADGRAGSWAEEIAGLRGTDARRLRARLRGDLDTIVLRAVRAEPERRYASAGALADDVERFLAGRPVAARPDTWGYRARKLVARRPGAVAAAVAAVLAIGVYAVTVTRYAERLETERDLARVESEKSREVTGFLVRLFEANNPDVSEGRTLTAFELLQQGEAEIDRLDSQPALQAQILDVIGQMYTLLGQYEQAEPLFRRAAETAQRVHAGPHRDVAGPLSRLGDVVYQRGRYAEADSVLTASLQMAKAADDAQVEANSYNDLALSLYRRGDFASAESLHRKALAIRQATFGPESRWIAASLNNIGLALEGQHRFPEAELHFREALAINRTLQGNESSAALTNMGNLARVHSRQGRQVEAELQLREIVDMGRARFGPRHPRVALSLNDLGAVLAHQERYAAAEEAFREALAIREATLGPEHGDVVVSLNNLGFVLDLQGQLSEALAIRRRVVDLARAFHGPDHLNTGVFTNNLATSLRRTGSHGEAERLYRDAIAILKGASPPDGHPLAARPLAALGDMLTEQGRAREAEPLLREALRLRRERDSDAAGEALIESQLGNCLAALARRDEAEELLRKGYEGLKAAHAPAHREVVAARERLVRFYAAIGDAAQSRRYAADG
jgi:eukaryotic-like serine/threonine-protein kinase